MISKMAARPARHFVWGEDPGDEVGAGHLEAPFYYSINAAQYWPTISYKWLSLHQAVWGLQLTLTL